MKTLKIAMTALGTGAAVLALAVTPTTGGLASTTLNVPSTHVPSEAPISAGPSRSECFYPTFDDTGLAALQAAVTSFDTLDELDRHVRFGVLERCGDVGRLGCLRGSPNRSTGTPRGSPKRPQSRQLVLAVDLIPSSLEDVSDPLGWEQSCAAGDFDSYATTLGTNLVAAGLENSVIRLGPEMNGTWEADFMGTTTQEQSLWATCFANEVTALRQAIGQNFLIDWNPNACKGAYPYANFYPGNAYVDLVGLDLYDVDCNAPSTSVTFSQLANEPYGLDDFEAFAASQGKPMSFPSGVSRRPPPGTIPGTSTAWDRRSPTETSPSSPTFDGGSGTSLPLGPSTPLSLAAYQEWFGSLPLDAATISGSVTAVGGGDLAGICVEAFLNGTDIAASATTAADGTYTIAGLAPGNYGVLFVPGCGSGNLRRSGTTARRREPQSAAGHLGRRHGGFTGVRHQRHDVAGHEHLRNGERGSGRRRSRGRLRQRVPRWRDQ